MILALVLMALFDPNPPLADAEAWLMAGYSYEGARSCRLLAEFHQKFLAQHEHLCPPGAWECARLNTLWRWRAWDALEGALDAGKDAGYRRHYLRVLWDSLEATDYMEQRMPDPIPRYR